MYNSFSGYVISYWSPEIVRVKISNLVIFFPQSCSLLWLRHNLSSCGETWQANDFEVDLAKFFDRAEDVVAFSKIVPKIGFFIEYRDSDGNLRLYYPDFVVLMDNNEHFIIEAKGREDVDVEHKDKRIKLWCEDATKLTKSHWYFERIDQEDFEKYRFRSIKELILTLRKR